MSKKPTEIEHAEQLFVDVKARMNYVITEFYEVCQEVKVDNDGFAEDVNEAVAEATNGKVRFETFIEGG